MDFKKIILGRWLTKIGISIVALGCADIIQGCNIPFGEYQCW